MLVIHKAWESDSQSTRQISHLILLLPYANNLALSESSYHRTNKILNTYLIKFQKSCLKYLSREPYNNSKKSFLPSSNKAAWLADTV